MRASIETITAKPWASDEVLVMGETGAVTDQSDRPPHNTAPMEQKIFGSTTIKDVLICTFLSSDLTQNS
jgi:hypothetical protein